MNNSALSGKIDNPMLGIILMLGAYVLFSFIDASAKWLALAGIVSFQAAFMRYFGAFIISLGIMSKNGIRTDIFVTDRFGLVFLRALLLAGSTIGNFISVAYLPLTLTSTILFSAPIIICALSGPLLGEKVGKWRWGAIFCGFIGILIAIRPFGESFHWAVYSSLISASCFAFYTIITRKLAGEVPTQTLQLYAGIVGSVILFPLAIWFWVTPDNLTQWILLIGLGFFGWFGHELMTRAHSFAPASTLTPFTYTFILYLTAWSYFLFDQTPDFWTIVGAAIIIGAGLVIWFREKNKSKVAKASAL